MDSIETTLGYQFTDSSLLEEALTHPSLAFESKRPGSDNQRLEFLGDAVLQLVLTDELFRRFPRFAEGRLTKLRSRLVSREGLCRCAEAIDLGRHLLLGRGEEANGGRRRPSNLADALEALAGAIYLDGGMEPAGTFIREHFGPFINATADQPDEDNPKGTLQEQLQSISPASPDYEIVGQEGPDHRKSFVAEVTWEGTTLGRGTGSSKKEAESDAALTALRERRWKDQ